MRVITGISLPTSERHQRRSAAAGPTGPAQRQQIRPSAIDNEIRDR